MAEAKIDQAVEWACKLRRDGMYLGKAITLSANYFKVSRQAVQSGVSARSGASQKGKKKAHRPEQKCFFCDSAATWKATMLWGYRDLGGWFSCDEHKGSEPGHYQEERGEMTKKMTKYAPSKSAKSPA